MRTPSRQAMLEREAVANRPKHWVRLVTACNSRCLFCLDSDTPRNVILPADQIKAELDRGRAELDAWKVILSGGEGALHPQFAEFCRYAREVGYGRVQTVTNGWRWADRDFYEEAVQAGLDEMTFSLHGHTAELHEHQTQHPGSFARIVRAIATAARDPRVITSVDVCINKGNVAHLDKIVELAIRLGVTEFDLLHVIPQASAFDNRDDLFYDPRDHLEVLHKVFRLNRHPRFVIWTNRFPVAFLEGLEDLIQDPHKMLDEVNGRRFQVRRYLDVGEPLACRQPERCVHCFIEPFCTTMDRTIAQQHEASWDVWWVGAPDPGDLPFGATMLGVEVEDTADLKDVGPFYARVRGTGPLDGLHPGVLVADRVDHLDAWLTAPIPAHLTIEVHLTADTATWLLEHRDTLDLNRVRLHWPSHEHMADATDADPRNPGAFFRKLDLAIRVSGLPACLAPGTMLTEPYRVLRRDLFGDNGRIDIDRLAHHHIADGYRSKSIRCRDCRVNDRCDGAHINFLRDQGLGRLAPLGDDPWALEAERQLRALHPEPPQRLLHGRPPERPAPSLPGYGPINEPARDPLAVLAVAVEERKRARRKKREERARGDG